MVRRGNPPRADQPTQQELVDRLTAERKTPDSRQSVKEALRDLQAEQKYGEDFPAPAEPIR